MPAQNFSTGSNEYAQYRPTYPEQLIGYLRTLHPRPPQVWDCGTGTGQLAALLSDWAVHVHATDLNRSQIEQATQRPNITYSVQPAESTDFDDDLFHVITVAQAIHWFDFDAFYAEARRVARPGAHLVVVGYALLSITPAIDAVIRRFYTEVIGPYWDPQRRYVDERYASISFPFEDLPAPKLHSTLTWTFEHLMGYLGTWSAVRHYEDRWRENPLEALRPELAQAWGDAEEREVTFPLLLRVGKL